MSNGQPELDSLFLAALDIESPEQRAAFLAQACGDDASLRAEVEQLLASHRAGGSFLERPAVEQMLASQQAAESFPEQPAPDQAATLLTDVTGDVRAASLEAGLAAAFTEEAAVVMGHAHHSVLQALGNTIHVPHVVLRESAEEGADPVVRPKSPEMPLRDPDSRYQLQGEIARGGMGAILKGRDTDLGRELAIKVLLDAHKDKPEIVERFIEEAQIGGQLQHPGIAPIYELGQFADRRPFFSMKLVKGETFSRLLSNRADPGAERGRFLGIFEQVCQTMAYAHSRGVIHRDLKPANIMVGAFGEVQVMDWGLAKVLPTGGVADEKMARDRQQRQNLVQTVRSTGSDAPGSFGSIGSQTLMGSVMGTPAYMPPEQAQGEVEALDERSDVFGLGAILCEILTGKPPYVPEEGIHVVQLAERGNREPCFQRLDGSGADPELIALTKHCLELEPHDRPRDAGVLAERVAGYLQSVETRLRETELERAAEAARAEAEGKRAEAEHRRAEAERQRAEAETRRLEHEQRSAGKLRKMIAGLAMVLAIAVGTSLVAGRFWQAANVARRDAEQNATLARQNAATALTEARRANEQTRLAENNLIKAEQARTEADENRDLLRVERDQGRQRLYFAEMTLAGIAAEAPAGLGRVGELLDHWGPAAAGEDLRGWEWYYLDSQARTAALTLRGHAGRAGAVAYSRDGMQLATGGDDKTVRIWNAASGRETACLRGHTGPVNGVDWSPDGARIASASGDGTVRIWDVASEQELRQIGDTGAPVIAVAWRPDGARVAATGHDIRVHVWEAETGREVISPHMGGGWGMALAWSPDGARLAFGSWDATARIIDGETGADVVSLTPRQVPGVLAVSWSPTGDRLATAGWDKAVRNIDASTGNETAVLPEAEYYLYAVCWSPDGKQMAAGGGNRAVQIWDVETRQARSVLRGNQDDVRALAWNPDGGSLAATSEEGVVRVWDVRPQSSPRAGQTQPEWAEARFSPDGTKIAERVTDQSIRISDAASGKLLVSLDDVPGRPWQTRWSPDGTRIACSGSGWALAVWDVQTGKRLSLANPQRDRHFALAWSPAGDRVATGSDGGRIHVWDPSSGDKLVEIQCNTEVWDLSWSPDGRRIASARWDGLASIWDAATGAELLTLRGHSGRVLSVGWSPDGKRIATGSYDRTVKLWDPATGQETLTLRGHAATVRGIFWHPDGCRLATRDEQSNLLMWDATPAFLAERSATTLRELSDRIGRDPADATARRLRAEVLARRGDWDAAAADFTELARLMVSAAAIYPAGWWALAGPADRALTFPPSPDATPVHWFAPADDPNGFVSLPQDGTMAVCRVFAAQAKKVALEIGPVAPDRLWWNKQAIGAAGAGPIVVELREGWNALAVAGGASELFVRWRDVDQPAESAE